MLFKHPDAVKRCLAISGVYDMRRFMNGNYDDNFYFNNPGRLPRQTWSDPWFYEQFETCDIHIVTGHGPWEDAGAVPPARRRAAQQGHQALARRLGPDGRPRLAVLEAPDAGVREPDVLNGRWTE